VSQISKLYKQVPDLGNIIVSDHAIMKAERLGISEFQFKKALFEGESIPEGNKILWKEAGRVRLIILLKPNKRKLKAAKLVKTMFIIENQKTIKRR
jgi:hypothetical protein